MQPPAATLEVELIRLRDRHGVTQQFMFVAGDGHGRAGYLMADDVPFFHGDRAWFEVEPAGGGAWPRWRAVRRLFPRQTLGDAPELRRVEG